jgi:hypothetical protein
MAGKYEVFQENPTMQAQIKPRRCSVIQVKFLTLLIDCNHSYAINISCRESARYEFSGKSLERNPSYN